MPAGMPGGLSARAQREGEGMQMRDEILGLRNIETAPQEVLLAAHNNIRRLLADAKLGDSVIISLGGSNPTRS